MAKYKNVKLKVARSGLPLYFKENRLVKGRLMLDGARFMLKTVTEFGSRSAPI